MPRHLFLAQSEESRGVVVENAALMLAGEERGLFDDRQGPLDDAGPDHLVRSEHHAVAETRVHDALKVPVERRARLGEGDHAHVEVHLGVRVQDGQQASSIEKSACMM